MSNQTNSRNQDNEAEAEHKIRLRSMEESVKQAPKSLIMTAGRSSCTVFRMPQSLKDIHSKAFEPRIISIGPYHHRKGDFKMIQEHKMRFLGAVLARTKEFHVGLDDFFKALAIKEKKIRECYSEDIECGSHDLIEMMVAMDNAFPNERSSLAREPNCFLVLKTLFELSTDPDSKNPPSLSELVLEFIECTIPIAGGKVQDKHRNLDGEHLLGLFCSTFIPSSQVAEIESNSEYLQLIQPAEKLRASGIKFKQRTDCESFLYIRFGAGGVLEIPTLTTGVAIRRHFLDKKFADLWTRIPRPYKFVRGIHTVMHALGLSQEGKRQTIQWKNQIPKVEIPRELLPESRGASMEPLKHLVFLTTIREMTKNHRIFKEGKVSDYCAASDEVPQLGLHPPSDHMKEEEFSKLKLELFKVKTLDLRGEAGKQGGKNGPPSISGSKR
ncbi:hypothetical protein GH714_015601 [Hevea brasiliensis]|uniref:Uncharacterized protein n=1 Tax=Hevea brasiliensis TaxID=3981 RepID=A0A6A6LH30_HEVBR|nr:hypothetical protein GH714_015601 [Hevea brasiliensis]